MTVALAFFPAAFACHPQKQVITFQHHNGRRGVVCLKQKGVFFMYVDVTHIYD